MKGRLITSEVHMKRPKCTAGLLIISLTVLFAGSASAWDNRWHFNLATPPYHPGHGTRQIEMQRKFDNDPMNRFKGTLDSSNGYTIMRNLNGGVMRGSIGKDGSGLLRDQDGTYYRVNTRW
jgi:hypothetical protein